MLRQPMLWFGTIEIKLNWIESNVSALLLLSKSCYTSVPLLWLLLKEYLLNCIFLITASIKELAKGVNCLQTCALTVVESVFLHSEGDPGCMLSPSQIWCHVFGELQPSGWGLSVTVHLLSLAVLPLYLSLGKAHYTGFMFRKASEWNYV